MDVGQNHQCSPRMVSVKPCETLILFLDGACEPRSGEPFNPVTSIASVTGVELDVSHVAGANNVIADDLSRWSFTDPIPHGFSASDRVRISLPQLWHSNFRPRLFPEGSKILWELPQPT